MSLILPRYLTEAKPCLRAFFHEDQESKAGFPSSLRLLGVPKFLIFKLTSNRSDRPNFIQLGYG